MAIRLKKSVFIIILLLAFSSCEKFEMRGFFLSYESANIRFEQSMEWNKDHPFMEIDIEAEEYTIFAMSDSHSGGTVNLNFFLDEAVAEGAVAALMAGDLTTGHAEDYRVFKDHLPDPDSLLCFPVVGNHDLYFDGWKQFYSLLGSSTYLFTVSTPQAADLFICLDTGGGTLGSDQLAWLKDVLQTRRSSYRHCIIFTHNNLFRIRHTASTNPPVEELRVLTDLCVRHNINMVLSGHDHKKNEAALGNTVHITMDALQDGYKDAGYLVLDIGPDRVAHEFVQLQ
ncbi:MAG: metallophosphoesterase [Bacteroidales bacterium]|nr:metallophosphoesterase [Bacteroidales bacterium]